jgi:hypothetical protein
MVGLLCYLTRNRFGEPPNKALYVHFERPLC